MRRRLLFVGDLHAGVLKNVGGSDGQAERGESDEVSVGSESDSDVESDEESEPDDEDSTGGD